MKDYRPSIQFVLLLLLAGSSLTADAQSSVAPRRVAYEEDFDAAEDLLIQQDYARLSDGAAGLQSASWQSLMTILNRRVPYRDQIPGGAIYFGMRQTLAGQRVLVYAAYRLHADLPGRGTLELWLLTVTTSGQLLDAGHYIFDDFLLFCYWTRPAVSQPWPHPGKHTLRIYTAQTDPADLSRFGFDYQHDRRCGRLDVRILDTDSNDRSSLRVQIRGR